MADTSLSLSMTKREGGSLASRRDDGLVMRSGECFFVVNLFRIGFPRPFKKENAEKMNRIILLPWRLKEIARYKILRVKARYYKALKKTVTIKNGDTEIIITRVDKEFESRCLHQGMLLNSDIHRKRGNVVLTEDYPPGIGFFFLYLFHVFNFTEEVTVRKDAKKIISVYSSFGKTFSYGEKGLLDLDEMGRVTVDLQRSAVTSVRKTGPIQVEPGDAPNVDKPEEPEKPGAMESSDESRFIKKKGFMLDKSMF